MKDTWTRIESWLRLNAPRVADDLKPGATKAKVAKLEKALGVTFPDDLRESFLIHDGAEEFVDGWELLSTKRVIEEWKVWKSLLDDGTFGSEESEPDPGVKSDWWNPLWVPLTYSGSGDHPSLDLDPAPSGISGQIILMWHDMSERPRLAASFGDWLRQFADDLEAGLYVDDEDNGFIKLEN